MGFTLLLWGFMFLIYFSSMKNKTNQWAAISIFVFSFGTFKEYLYFDFFPILIKQFGLFIKTSTAEILYSILTAVLYYLVMPCCVIFALYFASFQTRNIKLFYRIRNITFIPSIIIAFIFIPTKMNLYQHTSSTFWYVVTVYNLLFALVMAILMIQSIHSIKSPIEKRQKKLLCIITLPPIWYWLITIFVIHSFGFASLYKVWKDNSFLLAFSVLIYIVVAFTEGIMGLRLTLENYQWDSDMKVASKGTYYTSHILKNELTKIQWCITNLTKLYSNERPEELAIIERSTSHLKQFVSKTQLYSSDIIIVKQKILIPQIIEKAISSTRQYLSGSIEFKIACKPNSFLDCDPDHIIEVLNNLIMNAADAMDNCGVISISCDINKQNTMQIISIKDTGKGIPQKYIHRLFDPYFTTKKTNSNFGLGLTYCYNVVKKHNGYIDLKTEEGKGTIFSLYFPLN